MNKLQYQPKLNVIAASVVKSPIVKSMRTYEPKDSKIEDAGKTSL